MALFNLNVSKPIFFKKCVGFETIMGIWALADYNIKE